MNKTLFGKILIMSLAIILVVSIVSAVVMNFFIKQYIMESKKLEMVRLGQRVSDTVIRQIKRSEQPQGMMNNQMMGAMRLRSLIREMEDVVGARIWFVDPEGLIYLSGGLIRKLPEGELKLLLRGGQSNRLWSDEKGQPILAVSIPINLDGQVLGGLFIITPMQDIRQVQSRFVRILLISAIFGALCAVLIAYYFSRHLAKPIIAMQGLISQMRTGDFSGHLDIRREDELGALTRHFNDLNRELNQTTAQLRAEEEKTRRIINSMAEGVVSVSPEGEVGLINPAAMKILSSTNVDKYEINGLLHIFPGFVEHFEQVLREETRTMWEVEYNNQVIHIVASPIKTGKSVFGVVMILQDVTNRWKLLQLQKELVANVSHEFKTPLTSIKGFVELMLDKKIQDEKAMESSLKIIHHEAVRLTRMVNDILRTARLESLRVNKVPVNLYELVEKVVNSLALKLSEVKVTTDIAPGMQQVVQLDPDRMEQVFYNLIDNAIRFSPAGSAIEISAFAKEKFCEVTIRDHGPGIPVEEQDLIFDRFYKVEKARSTNDAGFGLGLAIVKSIVEEHGGLITVRNHPGGGAMFVLDLPY